MRTIRLVFELALVVLSCLIVKAGFVHNRKSAGLFVQLVAEHGHVSVLQRVAVVDVSGDVIRASFFPNINTGWAWRCSYGHIDDLKEPWHDPLCQFARDYDHVRMDGVFARKSPPFEALSVFGNIDGIGATSVVDMKARIGFVSPTVFGAFLPDDAANDKPGLIRDKQHALRGVRRSSRLMRLPAYDSTGEQTDYHEQTVKQGLQRLLAHLALAIATLLVHFLGRFWWNRDGYRHWLGGLLFIGGFAGLALVLGAYAFGSVGAFLSLRWL